MIQSGKLVGIESSLRIRIFIISPRQGIPAETAFSRDSILRLRVADIRRTVFTLDSQPMIDKSSGRVRSVQLCTLLRSGLEPGSVRSLQAQGTGQFFFATDSSPSSTTGLPYAIARHDILARSLCLSDLICADAFD